MVRKHATDLFSVVESLKIILSGSLKNNSILFSVIHMDPNINVIFIRITLEEPQISEGGDRPENYRINLSVYGCFRQGKMHNFTLK